MATSKRSSKGRAEIEALLRSEEGQEVLAASALQVELGNAVRREMERQHVSLYRLAKMLKKSETMIHAIRCGRSDDLNDYAQAFRVLKVIPEITLRSR